MNQKQLLVVDLKSATGIAISKQYPKPINGKFWSSTR